MLAGVLMASYAVLANDFLQTLSAFYSANQGRIAWGWQWGFICAVLVITAVSGWYVSGGDLGFGQLDLIPRPATFGWHHAVAPAVLLGVTMLRLPVSTTLMILSAFTTSLQLEQILTRSFLSYVGALLLGYGAWYVLSRWLNYNEFKPMSPKNRWFWLATLWGATAFMWVLWLRHDLANIVVFMPRHLSGFEVIVILGVMCGVLALLFHQKGGPIQIVMVDKTGHDQLRSAAARSPRVCRVRSSAAGPTSATPTISNSSCCSGRSRGCSSRCAI